MKKRLKREICRATKEFILESKNESEITMIKIADKLDMTAPTLYHYFNSKNDILAIGYEMIADELLAVFDTPMPRSMNAGMKLRTYLISLISFFKPNPDTLLLIFRDGESITHNKKVVAKKLKQFKVKLQELVNEWITTKKKTMPAEQATYLLLSILTGHLYYQNEKKLKKGESDTVEEIFSLFEKSIR